MIDEPQISTIAKTQKQLLKESLPQGHMPYPRGLKGPLNKETVVITGYSMLTNYRSKEQSLYRHEWEMWYNSMEQALAALKAKGGWLDVTKPQSNRQTVVPEAIYDFVSGQGRNLNPSDLL